MDESNNSFALLFDIIEDCATLDASEELLHQKISQIESTYTVSCTEDLFLISMTPQARRYFECNIESLEADYLDGIYQTNGFTKETVPASEIENARRRFRNRFIRTLKLSAISELMQFNASALQSLSSKKRDIMVEKLSSKLIPVENTSAYDFELKCSDFAVIIN